VEILPSTLLDSLGETKTDDGAKLNRSVARKRVIQKIQEDTPQKFFDKLDHKVLAQLVDAVFDDDEDKPSGKKIPDGLITKMDTFGLENALSTLSLPELEELAHAHKLKVSSTTSMNAYIAALMTGENQKAEKKKAEAPEKPSKNKPKIAKGITKIDLQHHFYREELVTYCKENHLTYSGGKTALINAIHNHLEGKTPSVASKKRKAPAGGKSDKPAKKSKTTKSEGEKSDKEDKSEKSEGKEDKKEEDAKETEKPKKGKKKE